MAVAFKKKNLKPEIQCISAKTKEQCMELIQVGCYKPSAINQINTRCSLLGRSDQRDVHLGDQYEYWISRR